MDRIKIAFVSFKNNNVHNTEIVELDTGAKAIASRIKKLESEQCDSVLLSYGNRETYAFDFPVSEKHVSAIAESVYRYATV